GWLPWRRPGFQLGLDLAAFAKAHPHAKGAVLEALGVITWGETSRDCYETSLRIINKAIRWFGERLQGKQHFGGAGAQSLPANERAAIAARLMPEIRARIGAGERKAGHFDDQASVLEFVNSQHLTALAQLGTSCPDHFLRTKIKPLVIPFNPAKPNLDAVIETLDASIAAYRADYA